jgi:hypothetical protein
MDLYPENYYVHRWKFKWNDGTPMEAELLRQIKPDELRHYRNIGDLTVLEFKTLCFELNINPL